MLTDGVLADGVLTGVSSAEEPATGVVTAPALPIEVLSLGVVAVVALPDDTCTLRRIAVPAAFGVPPPVCVAVGVFVPGGATGTTIALVLAFDAAALLCLVTGELPAKASELPQTPVSTTPSFRRPPRDHPAGRRRVGGGRGATSTPGPGPP